MNSEIERRIAGADGTILLFGHPALSRIASDRAEVRVLGKQLLRSWTSGAAHARETSRVRPDAEFSSMINDLFEKADESKPWLELMRDDCGIPAEQVAGLAGETGGLLAVYPTMAARLRGSG